MSDRLRRRHRGLARFGLARFVGFAGLTLFLALVLAACAGDGPRSSRASDSPTRTIEAPVRGASSTPLGSPTPLVVDVRLLQILPASVAGVAIQPSSESATSMATDPSLAQSASAIAVGVVVAAGSASGDDLAISTVTRLRPGVYSDSFYDQWRTAYDAAACEPAGGVSSHVQRLIGPHTVEVTICAQGARTYHTHLGGDVLVSITAVGDRRFGDLVMAGLRE